MANYSRSNDHVDFRSSQPQQGCRRKSIPAGEQRKFDKPKTLCVDGNSKHNSSAPDHHGRKSSNTQPPELATNASKGVEQTDGNLRYHSNRFPAGCNEGGIIQNKTGGHYPTQSRNSGPERDATGVGSLGNNGANVQAFQSPIDVLSRLTLHETLALEKPSSGSADQGCLLDPSASLEETLGVHASREVVDHFGVAPGQNEFGDIFVGCTLRNIMESVSGCGSSEVGGSTCDASNALDVFTGHTLYQLMDSLNSRGSLPAGGIVKAEPQNAAAPMGSNERIHPHNPHMPGLNPKSRPIPAEKNQPNLIPEYINTNSRESRTDVHPMLMVADNQANNVMVRQDTARAIQGLNAGFQRLPTHSADVLMLHAEDIDKMDRVQFQALASRRPVKVWSDFCRKFGHSGLCPFGLLCNFKNKDWCIHCDTFVLPRGVPFASLKHRKQCQTILCQERCQEVSEMRNAEHRQQRQTCQLCGRAVPHMTASLSERLYGILSNCDHIFCLECAKSCRKTTGDGQRRRVVLCPVCETYSPFYMTSNYWIGGEEKKDLLVRYVDSTKNIRCPFCTESSNSEIMKGTKVCYHSRKISTTNASLGGRV